MQVEIIQEEVPFDEFFKIYKADLKFERFDGSMSSKVTRYSFEKNDAVAALVYHIENDEYILVRQFRYPPFHHASNSWLTEIVAGGKNEEEDEEAAIRREVEEETGYSPLRLHRLYTCYVSPGLMSERVTIFIADVNEACLVSPGGGVEGEDEDIELVRIPRKEAFTWLAQQQNGDAKTIIAILSHYREH